MHTEGEDFFPSDGCSSSAGIPGPNHRCTRNGIDLMYPVGYNKKMIEIRQTETYRKWFASLRDSGGDKSTQAKDILKAQALAEQLEE